MYCPPRPGAGFLQFADHPGYGVRFARSLILEHVPGHGVQIAKTARIERPLALPVADVEPAQAHGGDIHQPVGRKVRHQVRVVVDQHGALGAQGHMLIAAGREHALRVPQGLCGPLCRAWTGDLKADQRGVSASEPFLRSFSRK
jgi:hypothetical protein